MLAARSLRGSGAGSAVCWAAGVWLSSCTLDLDLDRYRFVDPAGPPAADRAVTAPAVSGDGASSSATNDSEPSQLAGPRATPDPAVSASRCALGSSQLGRCTLGRSQ
jgi:hypothetical protein